MTYHLVEQSPWPLLTSFTLVSCIISPHIDTILLLLLIVFQWFRDIHREGLSGFHTVAVQKGLTLGF